MAKRNKYTYVTVALSNTPHYNSKISLMGKPFNIKCSYNTRTKKRWLIITDMNGNPILSQTFLTSGRFCELNFLSNFYNLNFHVTLKKKEKTKVIPEDYDYLNWAEDFDLFFVGSSQEILDKLEIGVREYYVR